MSEQKRGTALVVAHNNLHLTKKTVESLQLQTHAVKITVVDNMSSDGTDRWVTANHNAFNSCINYVQLPLARCWNIALRQIFDSHDECLVVNNDVELRLDTYEYMLNFLRGNPDSMFVTCNSVDARHRMDKIAPTTVHPDFSCFMLTRECFYTVGPFDEQFYPAWFEDNDYHIRLHQAGITAYNCGLPFLHHGSQTLKAADPAEKLMMEKGFRENQKKFQAKWGCLPGTPEYDALFK